MIFKFLEQFMSDTFLIKITQWENWINQPFFLFCWEIWKLNHIPLNFWCSILDLSSFLKKEIKLNLIKPTVKPRKKINLILNKFWSFLGKKWIKTITTSRPTGIFLTGDEIELNLILKQKSNSTRSKLSLIKIKLIGKNDKKSSWPR